MHLPILANVLADFSAPFAFFVDPRHIAVLSAHRRFFQHALPLTRPQEIQEIHRHVDVLRDALIDVDGATRRPREEEGLEKWRVGHGRMRRAHFHTTSARRPFQSYIPGHQ